MKTLVTGATGLVGNNVVRTLLDRGHEVRVLVRANCDPRPLSGLDVEVFHGDVRDREAVQRACQGSTSVIHAAAQIHIGWKGLDVQRAINVEGTRHVAEAALESGTRFVHVSSVDALGLLTGQVADEDTPRCGKTLCTYVVSKTEAEAEVRKAFDRGLSGSIVNPGFMLGPWDWKPSSGRMLLAVGKRFAALAPSGGCTVCDVRDVANGIVAAMEKGSQGQNYILGGFNMPYVELWRIFAKIGGGWPTLGRLGPAMQFLVGRSGDWYGRLLGREPDVNSAAMAMSSLYHYHSSARAQRELGYSNRPLEETVRDAWDWFRSHGYV